MIAEALYPLVANAKTAKETWVALKNAYADCGLLRRLNLLRKLFNLKLKDFSGIEQYVNEVQATHQALQSISQNLDDEFVAIIMLAGLPESFNALVMALEHSASSLTTEVVISALFKEGQRQQTTVVADNLDNSVLVSSGNAYRKKQVICHFCKKRGHYKWQCRKLNTDKAKVEKVNVGLVADNVDNVLSLFSAKDSTNIWVIDSGATSHMTSAKRFLTQSKNDSKIITTADNRSIVSKCQGALNMNLRHEGCSTQVKFKDVLYVPNLVTNILSVSKMTDYDMTVVFNKNHCMLYKNNDVKMSGVPLFKAVLKNGLYTLGPEQLIMHGNRDSVSNPTVLCASGVDDKLALWHRRLGHLSLPQMKILKNMVTGLSFKNKPSKGFCKPCCQGKAQRKKFSKRKHRRANDILELVHTDLFGPLDPSWGGARYCLVLVDDFSRKVFNYLLKSKTEVFEKFCLFVNMVENETGKRIKRLRSDNGTEYTNKNFQKFLESKGIRHERTVPYTPEQNGVAERTNRTIVEKVRCMLHDSNIDKRFWGEAVNCAVYLKNRSPTMALSNKVPEEVWTGKKVDLSHLRVFGSSAQVLVKDGNRKKMDSKTITMVMIGYADMGYKFVNLENPKRFIVARDAVFDETILSSELIDYQIPTDVFPCTSGGASSGGEIIRDPELIDIPIDISRETEEQPITVQDVSRIDSIDELETDEFQDSICEPAEIDIGVTESTDSSLRRYPSRNRYAKRDQDMVYNFLISSDTDPVSVKDIEQRSDKKLWQKAMEDEYNSLLENGTWELVNRPTDVNVVKCKWVFKLKTNTDGSIQRHKARLVAKGYSQKWGQDYFETFAPVIKLSSLRLLIGLAAEMNLMIHHIDVATAFLHGDLSEEIYMEQPESFVKDPRKVCKLKKAIYGLKQAARCWNNKIHKHIIDIGFQRSKYDPCVYIYRSGRLFLAIALYVDDFYFFGNDLKFIQLIKDKIGLAFKTKDLGEARDCLGMRISRNRKNGEINLDQSHYVEKVLNKFGMQDSKPVKTPMECGLKLQKGKNNEIDNYQEIIGSLMYLSCATRPDISFAVSYLSQFSSCADGSHLAAVKRVLRYLKGTIDTKLIFKKTNKSLVAYADADWGTNADGHSFSGYTLIFAGGAISWQACKQRCVALSTAEAEYIAICEGAKDLMFIKGLYGELTDHVGSMTMFTDSQSAKCLVYSPVMGKRSKHINIKFHYIKELVETEEIKIEYCDTNSMPADVLTKALGTVKHNYCLQRMGLQWGCCKVLDL